MNVRPTIEMRGIQHGVFLVVLVLLGIVSTQRSMAYILRSTAPDVALALSQRDARVLGAAAYATAQTPNAGAASRALAKVEAREALSREPGNIPAINALGLLSSIDGREKTAQQYFMYSASLSRRSLLVQLWLIEEAVAQQNIQLALQHYDIALRTSETAADSLYPILGSAIEDPEVRNDLVNILRKNPPWRETFQNRLANQKNSLQAVALLFLEMTKGRIPPSKADENQLMANFVSAGDVDTAWWFYRARGGHEKVAQPRNPTFQPSKVDGSPFDWGLINDGGITSSLGEDEGGGVLSFTAAASIAGVVAQQLIRLPAGQHYLKGHSRGLSSKAKDYVGWEVVCADGRLLGKAKTSQSDRSKAPFGTRFVVPQTNCTSQLLRLSVVPSDDIEGITGEITDVTLNR